MLRLALPRDHPRVDSTDDARAPFTVREWTAMALVPYP